MTITRKRILDLAGSALIAAVLSGSLALLLCSSLALEANPARVYLLCGALSLWLAALSLGKWPAVAGVAAVVLAALIALINGARPFAALRSLIEAFGGAGEDGGFSLIEHAQTIASLLAAVLTLAIYWMSRMSGGFYPALTLSIIVLLGGWLFESVLDGKYVVPVVMALIALFARATDDSVPYLRAIPLALACALIAYTVTPIGSVTYPPFAEAADKVRQIFRDSFMFTSPRTAYSLYADGYQPMADALGGPADPNTGDVMLVESDSRLLLRGTVKRTYTGLSWTDTAVNSRYLFGDITKRLTRSTVFDANALDGLPAEGLFRQVEGRVTMLNSATSTIFVPGRLLDLNTPIELVSYFNNSGEVFAARSLSAGDRYSFTALVSDASADLEALLARAAERGDDRYPSIQSSYTELPRGVEEGVYELTRQIIAGAQSPYQMARRIEDYLVSRCTYNLQVDYPPRNRDFVSYFLLETREGYCTYFASAMAVMARIAGLPSRYIEGYVAAPGATGQVIVTGENAHAWVEIYFAGAGWVSFNPTPGGGDIPNEGTGGDGAGTERGEDMGGNTPTAAPAEPTPTPGAEDDSQTETESEPTPEPDEAEGGEPTQSPENGPTPEPTEVPPEPDQAEEPPPDDHPRPPLLWPWLLALCLLLAVAIWLRLRYTDPRYRQRFLTKREDRLLLWYRALLTLLEQHGQTLAGGESPNDFAQRLKEAGEADEAFVYVTGQVSAMRYGGQAPEGAVFKQAAAVYESLSRQLRPVERARWIGGRLLHGLGDLERIP